MELQQAEQNSCKFLKNHHEVVTDLGAAKCPWTGGICPWSQTGIPDPGTERSDGKNPREWFCLDALI